MSTMTPQEVAQKHADRLKNASEDIRRGIQRTTVNPAEKAIAKIPKMLQGIQDAIKSGKVERGLRTVTLDSWKNKAAGVGVDRIAAGVDAALPDTSKFYAELLPHIDKVKAAVDQMPDLTLDQNIARSAAMQRGMAQFKRS